MRHLENPPDRVIKKLAALIHGTEWWDEVFERPNSPVIDWQGHLVSQRLHFRKMFKTPFDIELIIFFKDGILVSRWDDARINEFILEKHKADKRYLSSFCRQMEHDCIGFIARMEKINTKDLQSILDYFVLRNRIATYFRFVFNAASVLEPIVLSKITDPLKRNFISRYNEKLEEIKDIIRQDKNYARILSGKDIVKAVKALETRQALSRRLDKFIKEFSWINIFHHQGDYLRLEDLLREISGGLEARYSPNEFRKKDMHAEIEVLRHLIFLRTYAAEVNALCSAFIKPVLTELAQAHGFNHDDIVYLTQKEIIGIIKSGRWPVNRRTINSRKRGYAVIINNNTEYFIYGNSFKRLNHYYEKSRVQEMEPETSEAAAFKGMPACKGLARGVARIIRSAEDFDNFEKGDIVVTSMTTPNYVPILAKAAAIVTDEGGVTCHAAIISREMGIPCIIGTKIATKVLRSGDLVEVDAERGIVKILKRAEKL